MATRQQFRVKAIVREGGSAIYKTVVTAASPAEALRRVASRLGLGESEAFPPTCALFVTPIRH